MIKGIGPSYFQMARIRQREEGLKIGTKAIATERRVALLAARLYGYYRGVNYVRATHGDLPIG